MKNYHTDKELPEAVRKFLTHIQTIQNKSDKTVDEYAIDLRLFFRFMVKHKNELNADVDGIDISKVDIEFIKLITYDDILAFLAFLANERVRFHKSENSALGISATSRARKISCLRSFFKYLTDKDKVLDVNPVANLDIPQKNKTLPKYLSLEESESLLNSIDGKFRERDLCIIMLFLSCGMRVSELVGIDLQHIEHDKIRILGKGNKERMAYLNDMCIEAINDYLKVRLTPTLTDKNALFISRQGNRINVQTVKWLVKKYVTNAGLSGKGISAHKLRHTAATLMHSNGVDIRTLQEVLGHENLNSTMIYTHVENSNLRDAVKFNPISNVVIDKPEKN